MTLPITGAGPSGGSSSPLLTNLISYWKLDEASGVRVDSHGTNNLTDNNTVTSNPGKINLAGQFTKANSEYLSIASNATLQTGNVDFTFACWVYADSTPLVDILSKWKDVNNREYILIQNGAVVYQFYVSQNGTTQSDVVSATNYGPPQVNTWAYIIIWHDSGANTINIQVDNGVPNSAAYAVGVHIDTAAFCIGNRDAGARHYDGRIDEVGFWKRVLTAAERTQLYNGGSGLAYPFS